MQISLALRSTWVAWIFTSCNRFNRTWVARITSVIDIRNTISDRFFCSAWVAWITSRTRNARTTYGCQWHCDSKCQRVHRFSYSTWVHLYYSVCWINLIFV